MSLEGIRQKWLKGRKGSILTADDIEHYKHIIIAINRAIELMDEIDNVIEL